MSFSCVSIGLSSACVTYVVIGRVLSISGGLLISRIKGNMLDSASEVSSCISKANFLGSPLLQFFSIFRVHDHLPHHCQDQYGPLLFSPTWCS